MDGLPLVAAFVMTAEVRVIGVVFVKVAIQQQPHYEHELLKNKHTSPGHIRCE